LGIEALVEVRAPLHDRNSLIAQQAEDEVAGVTLHARTGHAPDRGELYLDPFIEALREVAQSRS